MKNFLSKLFTILVMALIIFICFGAYTYVIDLEDERNEIELNREQEISNKPYSYNGVTNEE